jgi:subtilisin family serine protease
MPSKAIFSTSLAALVLLAGCSDQSDLITGNSQMKAPQGGLTLNRTRVPEPTDRRNTRWWKMTDAELAQAVESAGGRVFIGFKEASAEGGVDNRGRVLTSAGVVRSIKEHLRSLNVAIEWESKSSMPMVGAKIPVALVASLRAHPNIDYIEPIFPGKFHTQVTPWNIERVQGPAPWPYSTGAGVKLLIMDTGIDLNHPDLSNWYVAWRCISDGQGQGGQDLQGHGTRVAGVAAAVNNTIDLVGAAHGVYLAGTNISVNGLPDPMQAACSLDVARFNGIFAVNMSFEMEPSTALTDQVIAAYYQNGMFMAASVGQNFAGPVTYPANLYEVVGVTAVDVNNTRMQTANVGSEVELSAPGVGIQSLQLGGGVTGSITGTSFAAPHVTAAAAVLKAYNSAWTGADIQYRLRNTAKPLGDANLFGFGLVQIKDALLYQDPPTEPCPSPQIIC